MKICIPKETRQNIGGGHSFIDNFYKSMIGRDVKFVKNYKNADIVFLASASMISKELFREIKSSYQKIVLRVDNFLRPSRNSNSGHTKMLEMATDSDLIIYQSQWSKHILHKYLKEPNNVLIYNSVDEQVFKPEGAYIDFRSQGSPVYMYSRYGRDDLKLWGKAYYDFVDISQQNPSAYLVIIGRYNRDLIEYNFDFFQGERFEYRGVISDRNVLARIYRGCDYLIAPYKFDAFSNTYLEALMSGCTLYEPDLSGGTKEMLDLWNQYGRQYFSLARMGDEYYNAFVNIL